MVDEIKAELNINTLDRMADYAGLADSEKLTDEDKLSLAISGWLLGSNHASTNLAVSLSLAEVRGLVQQYLRETKKGDRTAILDTLRSMEGNTCEMVARLVDHMKPPIDSPEPTEAKPGFYELSVPALERDEPNINYYVQLPPEYDPYRRYPMVVTLNGAGTTPLQQLDWWAGALDDRRQPDGPGHAARIHRAGGRLGQDGATRIRIFRPRTRRRAGQPARCLPAVFRRYRSGVFIRPLDGRRRGLGHGRWRIRTSGRG